MKPQDNVKPDEGQSRSTVVLGADTETIDRLYLEFSQFTKAKTNRDLQLEQLLFAVARKFPGETRFETALRYIREAEARANDSGQAAQVPNISN